MKQPSSMHQRFQAVRAAESNVEGVTEEKQSIEQAIIDVILAPLEEGEARVAGNDRKEREVGRLFATLSAMESWTLHRRLSNPCADDALAVAFARMIAERRKRLLAFLGDPKRRAASAA
jgi:hypothetical protein